MKLTRATNLLLGCLCLAICGGVQAATFSSGSNGSLGALVATNSIVLTTPPDGIFHYTTITVSTGAIVRFTRNEFNTPIFLLATGDVTIDGRIDVSGQWGYTGYAGEGGPGGFDGGLPPVAGLPPGDGQGPGGGKGGDSRTDAPSGAKAGSFGSISEWSSPIIYGNSGLQPLIGGSGGGGMIENDPGMGGGGGGGAILVASSTQILFSGSGSITAFGGGVSFNNRAAIASGSGGAIRLVAPRVAGGGTLNVSSSITTHPNQSFRGGYGRIRVDCVDRSGLGFQYLGRATTGTDMVALPTVIPRLSITEVAGQPIAEGTASTVRLQLPPGASPNQTVKLVARDFTGVVPITVVVSPENGTTRNFTGTIDMTAGNPGQASINVVIPDGVINRIRAWTR